MQNTKDKILQAGQRKFSQQGYEKTSMRDIADQVGVSKANIYHHFSSKQELLGKIIESAFETYKKEIRQIVSEHQQAEKQLRSAIISYFEYCEENQDLVRLLTREDIKQNEQ
ncbi:MAG: TetR/AcrR family transcriptional regulator, partial [Candidatus Magasanikbacteria bacterium]